MNTAELTAQLDRPRAEPRETKSLESEAHRHEAQALGEYLLAITNSADRLSQQAFVSHRPEGVLALGTIT